jgi:hypothetical protein
LTTVTAPRILVFGDHRRPIWLDPRKYFGGRESHDTSRHAVLERLAEVRAALILSTGDLVPMGSEPAWAVVDRELDGFRRSGAAIEAVPGNHETYGWFPRSGRAGTRMPRFLQRFPRVDGLRWGRRNVGPARLLLLDSNERVLTRDEVAAQEAWLDGELVKADEDVKVELVLAAWHHPPFTNTTKYDDDRFSSRSFLPRLRKSRKLGAVLCGHVHAYERFWADSVHWVVTGGGGAPAHRFPADHARWRHTPAFDASSLSHVNYVEIEWLGGGRATARSHHWGPGAGAVRWIAGDAFEIRPRGGATGT